MTLKQCTKEELLFIFKRLQEHYHFNLDYHISLCLSDIQYQREMKRIDEGKKLADYSSKKYEEYCEILKPYEGRKIVDVQIGVIKKADKCLKEAQQANKKYMKIMKISE